MTQDEIAKLLEKPVAWLYMEPNNPHLNVHYDDIDVSQFPHDEWFPVYKQPQRTWQGLTDSQIEQIYYDLVKIYRGAPMPWGQIQFGKALQAKLKEKNT
jgi:hypothetical protein